MAAPFASWSARCPAAPFYEQAARFVEEAERLERSVESWRQGYRSRLSIAASPMIARTFLPNVIRQFTADHPDVELSVLVTESVNIAVAVEQGRADVGDDDSPVTNWERTVERLPVFSHNHPDYWDPLLAALRQRGLNFRSMKVTQIDITLRFIERGLGVSFLPYSAVSDAVMAQRVQEVPAPDLMLPVTATYAVVPRHGRRPETQAFLEILRATHLTPGYA